MSVCLIHSFFTYSTTTHLTGRVCCGRQLPTQLLPRLLLTWQPPNQVLPAWHLRIQLLSTILLLDTYVFNCYLLFCYLTHTYSTAIYYSATWHLHIQLLSTILLLDTYVFNCYLLFCYLTPTYSTAIYYSATWHIRIQLLSTILLLDSYLLNSYLHDSSLLVATYLTLVTQVLPTWQLPIQLLPASGYLTAIYYTANCVSATYFTI